MDQRSNNFSSIRFAYIEFADLEATTKNYKEMQNKKIRDKEIIVDYVDERSSYTKKELKKEQTPKEKDLKRLHIGGFDKTATEKDLKKLFNGCSNFTLPISKKDSKLNMGSVKNFNFKSFTKLKFYLIP